MGQAETNADYRDSAYEHTHSDGCINTYPDCDSPVSNALNHVHFDFQAIADEYPNAGTHDGSDLNAVINVNIRADDDAKPKCDCLAATDFYGNRLLYRNDDSACDIHGSASSPATD